MDGTKIVKAMCECEGELGARLESEIADRVAGLAVPEQPGTGAPSALADATVHGTASLCDVAVPRAAEGEQRADGALRVPIVVEGEFRVAAPHTADPGDPAADDEQELRLRLDGAVIVHVRGDAPADVLEVEDAAALLRWLEIHLDELEVTDVCEDLPPEA